MRLRTGIALLSLAALAAAGETIEWAKNLEDARARSAKSGRPVLAYFTFDT